MGMKRILSTFGVVVLLGAAGCASDAGNFALGAGAAGAAYEYSNEQQFDELEKERNEGKISQEEYERRSQDIKDRSLIN